jgi:HEAT repeat protein
MVGRFRLAAAAFAALALVACGAEVTVKDIPALTEKARKGDGSAAKTLVEAMTAPDDELAVAAYQAVLMAGEACRGELLKRVRSNDVAVFKASAAALANLGEKKAVPDLLKALKDGGERGMTAVWALGMIGDPAAIPSMAAQLGDRNVDIRKVTVRALVRMGPQVVGEVLKVWGAASDPATERAAIHVVGELRVAAALPKLLAARPENREVAVWALGRINDKAAVDSVRAALEDPRWQVRRQAAQALGTLGDASDVPRLRRALDDNEMVVREWAARSLTMLTDGDILYRDEDGKMVPPYNLFH